MDSSPYEVSERNDDGSCWTCRRRGLTCDSTMPVCRSCTESNLKCEGYSVRVRWPSQLARSHLEKRGHSTSVGPRFSSLGLGPTETYLLKHFATNVARNALAVDYDGNGYRKYIQAATGDSLLLNSILSVAASHYHKWHQSKNDYAPMYLSRAMLQLQQRLQDSGMVGNELTLAAMMFLVSHEVYNGSDRWRHHYIGVSGWLRTFGPGKEMDPFLKSWVGLLETRAALNFGIECSATVTAWIESSSVWGDCGGGSDTIDPILGYSIRLSPLVLRSIRLSKAAQLLDSADTQAYDDLKRQVDMLAADIVATKLSDNATPCYAFSSHDSKVELKPILDLTCQELTARAVATAEIFRHAHLIYVWRILEPPSSVPPLHIQESIDAIFELLPLVPDCIGPGAILGWALVIVACEIDTEDQRQYICYRWRCLHALHFHNTVAAEKLTNSVWLNRDRVKAGLETSYRPWQEIMQDTNAEQGFI